MDNKDEEQIDNIADNIHRGLEMTVVELQKSLPDQVSGMGANALRRVLNAVIMYPDMEEDNLSSLSEREQKFMASMMALHQAGVQLEIRAIGQLQQEFDRKQKQQGEK